MKHSTSQEFLKSFVQQCICFVVFGRVSTLALLLPAPSCSSQRGLSMLASCLDMNGWSVEMLGQESSVCGSHDISCLFFLCFLLLGPSKEHQKIRCWRLWLIGTLTHRPPTSGWNQASRMKIASKSEVPWVWWRFAWQEKGIKQVHVVWLFAPSFFLYFVKEGAVIIFENGWKTWFNWCW